MPRACTSGFGRSQDWFVTLGAASAAGALVMGYVSAQRSAQAPVDSAEEYARVLAEQLPHMPVSLRRLIPEAVAVRAPLSQDTMSPSGL